MKPTVHTTMYSTPHPNALPHGLNSGHVLLPGDNIAKFRELRHGLFLQHQPRTYLEARCVEALAANDWRIARCRAEQRFFKAHLGAAMAGHPDTAGSLWSPDLHRLHHRATDCHLEEQRLEKSTIRAERTLAWLQQERTANPASRLAAGQRPFEEWMAHGEPVLEEEAAPDSNTDREEIAERPEDRHLATASVDKGSQTFAQRNPVTPLSALTHTNPVGRPARAPAQTKGRRFS